MLTFKKIDDEIKLLTNNYKKLHDEFFNKTSFCLPKVTNCIVAENLGTRYYIVQASEFGKDNVNLEPAMVSVQRIKQIVSDEKGNVISETILKYEYCVLELRWRKYAGRICFDTIENNFTNFGETRLLITLPQEKQQPKQYYITLTNKEFSEEHYKGLELQNKETKIRKAKAELERLNKKIAVAKKKLNKE